MEEHEARLRLTFYMAGDGALTIDSRYAGAAVSNQALFTFNLSQYSTLDNVKWIFHIFATMPHL